MAEGLQYKENLTLISGGYPGENPGSDGVVQDWTETTGYSGSSTVTYHYNDSAQMTNANSTYVEINITDTWTATKDNRNYYHITVSTTINYIRRTKVGNPSPLSVYMFARHDAGGANIWTSGGCVDAANSGTNATNINMGTTTIDLAPGQSTNVHGTVYFRSNICGHNNAKPPSIYVDEFWLGVNFRNTLPPDYRPGKTWNGSEWLSHNREAGNVPTRNLITLDAVPDGTALAVQKTFTGSEILLNGTTNGAGGITGSVATGVTLPAGTYTFTLTVLGGEVTFPSGTTALYIRNGSNSEILAWNLNTRPYAVQTRTLSADTPIKFELYTNAAGQVYDNYRLGLQIEKGSSSTPYIPYGTVYFSAGATDIYTSATSKNTMRTQDGGVGTNNPPYTRHNDNTWRNQRKIGIE